MAEDFGIRLNDNSIGVSMYKAIAGFIGGVLVTVIVLLVWQSNQSNVTYEDAVRVSLPEPMPRVNRVKSREKLAHVPILPSKVYVQYGEFGPAPTTRGGLTERILELDRGIDWHKMWIGNRQERLKELENEKQRLSELLESHE